MVNVWVTGSIFDSRAYTVAWNVFSFPSRMKSRPAPIFTSLAYRSGTANSTFRGESFVSLATMVEGEAYVPTLTCRRPMTPSKGARSSVCAMLDSIRSMSAFRVASSVFTCS